MLAETPFPFSAINYLKNVKQRFNAISVPNGALGRENNFKMSVVATFSE
jgi:hypothetical protein